MIKRKIICILLAIILIISYSIVSFASDISNNIQENTLNSNQENNLQNTEEDNQENTQSNSSLSTNEINELNKQKDDLDGKIEEANHKLEYVQGEMSTSLLEIQKLSDKIAQYESENKELAEKLADLDTSITETTQLLQTVTEEYNQKDQLLKERLVTVYEEGELSFLDVLLSSRNFMDMLSSYYIMQEMAEYDNQLIEKVSEQRKTIDNAKRKLENENAQVKILKAKAEQNEIVVKNTKTLHEGYVKKLSDQEKELNDKINAYKIEYAQIQSQLQRASTETSDIQIQYTGGKMLWPVASMNTTITSNYGTRVYPIAGTSVVTDFHLGLDIAAPAGTPVVAALDGVVTYAGWLGSYGYCVMIYHGEGITTVYAHSQKLVVEKGDEVKQGQFIMEVGSTGNSTGPHCHFEVRINGQTTDPLQFVNKP